MLNLIEFLKSLKKRYSIWHLTHVSRSLNEEIRNIIDKVIDDAHVDNWPTCLSEGLVLKRAELRTSSSYDSERSYSFFHFQACACWERRPVSKIEISSNFHGIAESNSRAFCLFWFLHSSEHHLGTIQNRHARSHFRFIKLASTYTPSSYPSWTQRYLWIKLELGCNLSSFLCTFEDIQFHIIIKLY